MRKDPAISAAGGSLQPAYAAADVLQEETAILGADKLEDALPDEAAGSTGWVSPLEQGSFSGRI